MKGNQLAYDETVQTEVGFGMKAENPAEFLGIIIMDELIPTDYPDQNETDERWIGKQEIIQIRPVRVKAGASGKPYRIWMKKSSFPTSTMYKFVNSLERNIAPERRPEDQRISYGNYVGLVAWFQQQFVKGRNGMIDESKKPVLVAVRKATDEEWEEAQNLPEMAEQTTSVSAPVGGNDVAFEFTEEAIAKALEVLHGRKRADVVRAARELEDKGLAEAIVGGQAQDHLVALGLGTFEGGVFTANN